MRPSRHLSLVSPADVPEQPVTRTGGVSSGVSFQSRFDPHAFRRTFPDRWSAFLRAHHRDATEVAYFYGVTDRAARDWWEGVSGPRGAVVALAAAAEPEGFARMVLGRAA
jgi:hypothetical protein